MSEQEVFTHVKINVESNKTRIPMNGEDDLFIPKEGRKSIEVDMRNLNGCGIPLNIAVEVGGEIVERDTVRTVFVLPHNIEVTLLMEVETIEKLAKGYLSAMSASRKSLIMDKANTENEVEFLRRQHEESLKACQECPAHTEEPVEEIVETGGNTVINMTGGMMSLVIKNGESK